MTRLWTIIGVADVPKSFGWYQSLLGQTETAPVHDYFGQILDEDGTGRSCSVSTNGMPMNIHRWRVPTLPRLAMAFSCFSASTTSTPPCQEPVRSPGLKKNPM